MSRRKWIAPIVLALIGVGLLRAFAAEETAPEQPTLDFKGRVVLLIVDYSNAVENRRGTEYVENAVLQKLGNRYFITGKAYSMKERPEDAPPDWRKGSRIGIAWEKVQQFYAFSPEQMDEIMKRRMEEEEEDE